MKAVVVDITEKYAVAMDSRGQFVKIRNNGRLNVGYEVEVPSFTLLKGGFTARVAAIAAAFLLMTSFGFGAYAYYTPYSFIDVDINPSIELVANRFDRIIGVDALNEDGRKLLSGKSYKNLDVGSGIENILKAAVDEGYITPDAENAVMLTVSTKNENKVEKLEEKVQQKAEKELTASGAESRLIIDNVSLQKREEARDKGLSPGKLLLIERLKEYEPGVKMDEVKNAPVKDILKSIGSYKKEEKAEDKSDGKKSMEKKNNDKKDNSGNEIKNNSEKKNNNLRPSTNKKEDTDKNAEEKKQDRVQREEDNKSDSRLKKDIIINPKRQENTAKQEEKQEDRKNSDKNSKNNRTGGINDKDNTNIKLQDKGANTGSGSLSRDASKKNSSNDAVKADSEKKETKDIRRTTGNKEEQKKDKKDDKAQEDSERRQDNKR